MNKTKEFLCAQRKRIATNSERNKIEMEISSVEMDIMLAEQVIAEKRARLKKLHESNKFFKKEYEELVNAYVEVLMVENPIVYASTIFCTQPNIHHVKGIWRTQQEAITFLEEICDGSDSDCYRVYDKTRLAQPLKNFKAEKIQEMAIRELERL